ncbi:MAG: hypothetical protein DRR11_03220 [Gammaproteobacteria bacterium]|nr:MAG: hypothetical protein DRR15_18115 [Gammaproteobacteria bacterium]RLA34294.1 MAG: hypothetical protein DRR11_03220 [Gammaproteobacteria bacterium]
MPDNKDISFASDYTRDAEDQGNKTGHEAGTGSPAPEQSDPDGWQQYRKWISKAPAPRGRRSGVDPSLYTWKGYRNWTEQIKRNWSDS